MAQDPIDTLRRSAYPNPERRGCPNATAFEALKRREVDVDDPVWTHIERCSECYRQFAAIREGLFQEERRSDVKRLMPVAASVAALLLLVVVGIYIFRHRWRSEHQPIVAVNRVETVALNLQDVTEQRGIDVNDPEPAKPRVVQLPRKLVNLNVHLPLGSPAGEYEFEILNVWGKSVWQAKGHALIKEGVTLVQLPSDLHALAAGEYILRFRSAGDTWREMPVAVGDSRP